MTAALAVVGHNSSTDAQRLALKAVVEINLALMSNPVISTAEAAEVGGKLIKTAKAAMRAMEDERKGRVKPLNDTVAEVNDEYRTPRSTLERVLGELEARLTVFVRAEERRRAEEAAKAAREAEEAERAAREAERVEAEALANAKEGEVVDVAAVTSQADEAFSRFDRASRLAKKAEKGVPVRLGGSAGSRAVSLRMTETLLVTDPVAVLQAVGMTDGIRDALLSAARDYRRQHQKLPEGIAAHTERKL